MYDPHCPKSGQESDASHNMFPGFPLDFPSFLLPPLPFPPLFNAEVPHEDFESFMSFFPFDPSLFSIMPLEDPVPEQECFKPLRPATARSHTRQIGPITVEERRDKISRFLEKRKRRNFSKKVSYACRKRVADSRLRVKGRFIKKVEADALCKQEF